MVPRVVGKHVRVGARHRRLTECTVSSRPIGYRSPTRTYAWARGCPRNSSSGRVYASAMSTGAAISSVRGSVIRDPSSLCGISSTIWCNEDSMTAPTSVPDRIVRTLIGKLMKPQTRGVVSIALSKSERGAKRVLGVCRSFSAERVPIDRIVHSDTTGFVDSGTVCLSNNSDRRFAGNIARLELGVNRMCFHSVAAQSERFHICDEVCSLPCVNSPSTLLDSGNRCARHSISATL